MDAVVPSSHLCDFGAVWGHAKGAGEDAKDGLWSEQGYAKRSLRCGDAGLRRFGDKNLGSRV
jgi:hypothetical protein